MKIEIDRGEYMEYFGVIISIVMFLSEFEGDVDLT